MLTYKYKIIQGDMVGQSPSISDMIGQSPFNYNLSIIQLLETNRHGKRMVRRMRFSILTLTHKYKITQGVRCRMVAIPRTVNIQFKLQPFLPYNFRHDRRLRFGMLTLLTNKLWLS